MAKKVTAEKSIKDYLDKFMLGYIPNVSIKNIPGTFEGLVCTGFEAPLDPSVNMGTQFKLGESIRARVIGIRPVYGGRPKTAEYSLHIFYLH
jgi:hypothetical protein